MSSHGSSSRPAPEGVWMTEAGTSQYAAQGGGGTNIAVEVMDVLMRGLDTARRNIGAQNEGEGGQGGEAGLFCGFAYGSPGTFCPLFYWHSETLTEEPV